MHQKSDIILTEEEKFGYFRPGFFPATSNSIMPAMVYLSNIPFTEPDIQFILVKTNCCLPEWQDALTISEKDFDQAIANCEKVLPTKGKMTELVEQFKAKGYYPHTELNQQIHEANIH